MTVPPWVREATEPTRDEVAGMVDPIDPALLHAVRRATAPSSAELARLRPRAHALAARRGVSPMWLVAPVAAVLALLTARWVVPSALDAAHEGHDDVLMVVHPGDEVLVVRGVTVQGEGSAQADGRTVELRGELRVVVSEPATLVVDGAELRAERAEVILADHTVVVVLGAVHVGERALGVGETWSSPLALALPTIPPEPQPVATVALRDPVAPEAPPTAPTRIAPAPLVAAVPEPAPPEPVAEAPAPETPAAEPTAARPARGDLEDWRRILAELETDPSDQRRVALLDAYRESWPDSPFALEAEAMSLLASTHVQPAQRSVDRVERWLVAHPDGPRALDLHAAAAFLWRESLGQCGRATPHDLVVSEATSGARHETAEALIGLCALSSGDPTGRERLLRVDTTELEPALRKAVEEASSR